MLDGSYEVAWRLREAGPKNITVAYSKLVPATGTATAPIITELDHMGMDAMATDVYHVADPAVDISPNEKPPQPLSSLEDVYTGEPYGHLGNERLLFVGAGAGSIIAASHFVRRGIDPENITIADPRGTYGGIWNEEWARAGGFNNPKPLAFDYKNTLRLSNREGTNMHAFLRGIAADYLQDVRLTSDKVVDLYRRRGDQGEWNAATQHGERLQADTVIVATGRPQPRRIDGEYFSSNLDRFVDNNNAPDNGIIVERSQRKLTKEDLTSGRPIILIGLGNSTAAMLTQIHAHNDAHPYSPVRYKVLTHRSRFAVDSPHRSTGEALPIFRNSRMGYLTGYSADLPRDAASYHRAQAEGAIKSEVTSIMYDTHYRALLIDYALGKPTLEHTPHVFALLGTDRDPTVFRKLGALGNRLLGTGKSEPDIRPSDGAIATSRDGYLSNAFAIGAAAGSKRNLNAVVIPGIMGQTPATLLTIAARAVASKH